MYEDTFPNKVTFINSKDWDMDIYLFGVLINLIWSDK